MLQEEAAEIAKQLAKPEYAEFKAQVDGLRNGKTRTVFLNVLLRGNLVKSRSKQLKPGWKDCLKSLKATS